MKKQVKVYTMAQGFDIITEVVTAEDDDSGAFIKWKNPMVITLRPTTQPGKIQTSLSPMLNFVKGEEMTPNLSLVLFGEEAREDVVKQYEEVLEKHKTATQARNAGIVMPPPPKAGSTNITT